MRTHGDVVVSDVQKVVALAKGLYELREDLVNHVNLLLDYVEKLEAENAKLKAGSEEE